MEENNPRPSKPTDSFMSRSLIVSFMSRSLIVSFMSRSLIVSFMSRSRIVSEFLYPMYSYNAVYKSKEDLLVQYFVIYAMACCKLCVYNVQTINVYYSVFFLMPLYAKPANKAYFGGI